MARQRSPEKRSAILDAAVEEIAESGLAAATTKIAARAGVATGTLFLYFPSKEALLNELYLELKRESYAHLHDGMPRGASLERRLRHLWVASLGWHRKHPKRRKVSMLLNISDELTSETRKQSAAMSGEVGIALRELEERSKLHGLPAGFAVAIMSSMMDATMEFILKQPRRQEELAEQAFQAYWKAVK